MMRVLIIQPDGNHQEKTIRPDAIVDIISGERQAVILFHCVMVVGDSQSINRRAEAFAYRLGGTGTVYGPAVFLGLHDDDLPLDIFREWDRFYRETTQTRGGS